MVVDLTLITALECAVDALNGNIAIGQAFLSEIINTQESLMTIPATILSDEQLRVLRDNEPTLSDRQGIDLGKLLNDWAALVKADVEAAQADADAIVSGTGVILSGNPSLTITAATLGGSYGGKPVVVTLNETDGTLYVLSAVWSTNDLVVTLSGNATDDRTFSYMIDAR